MGKGGSGGTSSVSQSSTASADGWEVVSKSKKSKSSTNLAAQGRETSSSSSKVKLSSSSSGSMGGIRRSANSTGSFAALREQESRSSKKKKDERGDRSVKKDKGDKSSSSRSSKDKSDRKGRNRSRSPRNGGSSRSPRNGGGSQSPRNGGGRQSAAPAITEEVAKRKGVEAVAEYTVSEDLDEAILCIRELEAPQFHKTIVYEAIAKAMDKKDKDRVMLAKFLTGVGEDGAVGTDAMEGAITDILDILPDMVIDTPMIGKYMSNLIGVLAGAGVIGVGFLAKPPQEFLDSGKAASTVADALQAVQAQHGPDRVKELLGAASPPLDIAALLPELIRGDVAKANRLMEDRGLEPIAT